MWMLWRKSPESPTSKKGRYCSLLKKRTREDGLRKKVSRRWNSNRKGKGERRSSLKGQTRAESRAWRLLLAVGATGCWWHLLASRRRMRGWRFIIESVAAGQPENRLVNVSHIISVVRIQTVGQDEQAEKQWRCIDPSKSHHYESWKNPRNGSFGRVKVSWRENGVVTRIAVLLVSTGMAPFVSRNRRTKGCQLLERWMLRTGTS